MNLLDTSILIKFIEKQEKVVNFVSKLEDKIFISAITIAEVAVGYYWQSKEKRDTHIKEFKNILEDNKITLLVVDDEVGFIYGEIQATLKKQGNLLSPFDGIIAATAICHDLSLITLDKDFKRVKGLRLYFPNLKSS